MSTQPPNKPGSFGRLSKTIAFWMLVILVPVAFIQFSSAKNDAAEQGFEGCIHAVSGVVEI